MPDTNKFKPKLVKLYNYTDEVKEVVEVDFTGFRTKGGRKGNYSHQVSEEDRIRNLKRVKRNVRRLAFANDIGQIHLVLTYVEVMEDVDKADTHFKCFMRKLHEVYPNLMYIATREFQKRGSLHYHVLLNQRIDVHTTEKLWNHGFIKLKQHKDKLKAVLYILKYISKEVGGTVLTTKNGHTKKAYLSSKGLKKGLDDCTEKFIFNTEESYLEYSNGIDWLLTNLTEGWDFNFEIELKPDHVIHCRSILRCAANNY